MLVVHLATMMLVDLFVAITRVTVSVAIMQLEVSAAFMQVKVSADSKYVGVTIVFEIIQVVFSTVRYHYAHDYFYGK